MFRSILVPLDGSGFAEEAIPVALSIAHQARASLEITRVHEPYLFKSRHGSWAPFNPAEDEMLKEQEQAYLDSIITRLAKTDSTPATAALVDGLIEDAILRRARTKCPDMIVMATHGRSPLNRFCFGSVAEELVRHGPAPILLVHPGEAPDGQGPKPAFQRILIPLDGSELAERVLEPATAIGTLTGAQFALIRAVEPSSLLDGFAAVAEPRAIEYGCEQRRSMALTYLDRVAERLRTRGLYTQTHVVSGKSPAAAVLDVARGENIDLIAVATHGRSALRRLLLGSVAETIVWRSPVPVLAYCPN